MACLAKETGIITVMAQLFAEGGAEGVMTMLPQWGEERLRSMGIDEELLAHLSGAEAGEITADNQSRWAKKSQRFRTRVRGVRIGSLG